MCIFIHFLLCYKLNKRVVLSACILDVLFVNGNCFILKSLASAVVLLWVTQYSMQWWTCLWSWLTLVDVSPQPSCIKCCAFGVDSVFLATWVACCCTCGPSTAPGSSDWVPLLITSVCTNKCHSCHSSSFWNLTCMCVITLYFWLLAWCLMLLVPWSHTEVLNLGKGTSCCPSVCLYRAGVQVHITANRLVRDPIELSY